MTVLADNFRQALRHFPSGVTIVTIQSGDQVHGLTVSAFASISPDPALIMVAIDHKHSAFELLEKEGARFAVNILHQEQVDLSNRFAWVKDEDRFADGEWAYAPSGTLVLANCLAWLDCSIYARHTAGTHTIYVGEVQAAWTPREGDSPLIYWNRDYRQLQLGASEEA